MPVDHGGFLHLVSASVTSQAQAFNAAAAVESETRQGRERPVEIRCSRTKYDLARVLTCRLQFP